MLVVLDVVSSQPLLFDQAPGSRVPLHVSAMGKCLLAHGNSEIDQQIAGLGELVRATHRTITDRGRLRAGRLDAGNDAFHAVNAVKASFPARQPGWGQAAVTASMARRRMARPAATRVTG